MLTDIQINIETNRKCLLNDPTVILLQCDCVRSFHVLSKVFFTFGVGYDVGKQFFHHLQRPADIKTLLTFNISCLFQF